MQTDPPSSRSGSIGAAHYVIEVEGHLDNRWTAWFDGMALDYEGGTTVISGAVADQQALHGLLGKVRDLALPLRSVRRTDIERTTHPTVHPMTHPTVTHTTPSTKRSSP